MDWLCKLQFKLWLVLQGLFTGEVKDILLWHIVVDDRNTASVSCWEEIKELSM